MAVPASKDELLAAIDGAFAKLAKDLATVPAERTAERRSRAMRATRE